jgi:AraC-like DNA-binding protein
MKRQEAIRVLSAPIEGVTAVLSATARHFDRHWHATYCFGLLDYGAQSWRGRGGNVDAYQGAIINTVPGEVHDGRPIGGTPRIWRMLSVEPSAMGLLTRADARTPEIISPIIHDRELAHSLGRVFNRLASHGLGPVDNVDSMALEEDLVVSCSLFVNRYSTDPSPRDVDSLCNLSLVRERLADELFDVPPLSELAAGIGLSRFQLIRHFKRAYGMPPHAWLLCSRAERAKRYIAGGETLAEAAARSGFTDQSHMTRTFVRFYGYTPGQCRSAIQRNLGRTLRSTSNTRRKGSQR